MNKQTSTEPHQTRQLKMGSFFVQMTNLNYVMITSAAQTVHSATVTEEPFAMEQPSGTENSLQEPAIFAFLQNCRS